jgi:2-polyprenyl-3-methyl-5-hydroxy-6-metoxy-1,4-benzoquinol methylase
MTTDSSNSLYDSNDYYKGNRSGSRLSPILDGLLLLFEWERYFAIRRLIGGLRKVHDKKVLDVGAGDGKFLHMMRKLGLMPFGTTASSRSAAAAKALHGIKLDVSETLTEVAKNGPFTLVTYWHVYEHLTAPSDHENLWRTIIEKNGLLVIEVPNIESYGSKICFNSWLGSDPIHHINHQVPSEILQRIKKAGLTPFRTSYFSAKFSFVFLWSALLGWLFPKLYTFDSIMETLKNPFDRLWRQPITTLNIICSIIYLSPIVVFLMLAGVVKQRGEVVRIYARR